MSAPKFIGVHRNLALYESRGKSVVVNTKSLTASIVTGTFDTSNLKKDVEPQAVWAEIASAAEKREIAPKTISLSESNRRTYTVPKRVALAAGTARRNELFEGQDVLHRFTATATHVSALLSSGKQVSCEDVLWCSRFFENHTKDNTPHQIWMAWGGKEGQRWAESLASRLDYDAVVADAGAYETPGVQEFVEGDETTRTFWAVLDKPLGQNALELYKLTEAGTWQAWGNGDWIECADEPEPSPRFIELDDDAALYLAGALFDAPDSPIDLRTPNPEAWDLAISARDEIDWTLADRVVTAAVPVDEGYSPEERAANAEGQLRDANGRFAEVGAAGAIKSSGIAGTITAIDSGTKMITVQGEDGNSYEVPGEDFEVGAAAHPKVDPSAAKDSNLDFSGILAPDKVQPAPHARLSASPTVLGPVDITGIIDEYSDRINAERQQKAKDFKALLDGEETISEAETEVVQAAGIQAPVDVNSKAPAPTPDPTPDETDVDPIYFAIVDPDDPQAVMDLISLVPATAVSNDARTYRRSGGKWVEAPEVLRDLRSATPPAVIQLDADQYADVVAQVDMSGSSAPAPSETDPGEAEQTVTAAGGLDKNRGNAEELRRYWVHGEGAAKIRWGTPGDFDRCVRLLSKHLGERAKGYCNLRHKDAIGIYPPTHAKQEASVEVEDSTEELPQEIVDALEEINELPEEEFNSLVAAGGADRNKGNAEELRKYWTVGPGGLKIRWNTGGDWTRCVRLLSKHLGPRAKGYCALRHHEMTGMWPGDKKNREMSSESLTAGGDPQFSDDYLKTFPAVLRASADFAAAESARMRVFSTEPFEPVPPTAEDIDEGRSGKAFRIPLLIPEGLATGDGRIFGRGSLGIRTLPIPLLWQINTGEGHNGAVLVGKIERVERTPDGLGNAYGVFDTGPYGKEAQRLVEAGMLRWGSADLDKFEVDEGKSDEETGKLFIKKGRLMGWTLVPKPAFQECTIELLDNNTPEENEMPLEEAPITASASIAKAIPVEPPSLWFDRPLLNGPTPITVMDDGRVFGHIATWDTDHIGHNQSVRAPRSASNYSYFHTGVVRTNDGKDIKVGQLTLAGGHASLHADAMSAMKHYDDTKSAIADVHAGEDSYGIYVSGALRPGATPEQIRALRASAPSGDWRAINHRLELVAVCQVNVPGFPVPRNMTAGGEMQTLVAAGASTLLEMQKTQHTSYDETIALSAKERLWNALGINEYIESFGTPSKEKRDDAAEKGNALPDGSFPINTVSDLRKAIHAYGRAEESKKAKVRRHIVKRARALDKPDLIPSQWKEASLSAKAIAHRDQYDAMVASALAAKVAEARSRVFQPTREELEAIAASAAARISKK